MESITIIKNQVDLHPKKTPSKEPRDFKQVYNRQDYTQQPKESSHTDHLNTLLMMETELMSLI